jgi:hypothetical protein
VSDTDLPPIPESAPEEGQIYQHYKGTHYIVDGIARHSETLEPMVIYRKTFDEVAWARPLRMWNEEVITETYQGPRFIYVSQNLL